jgi:hypothetical protein
MSRGTERNYLDPVAIGSRRLNSTLNAEERTAAQKATTASTAVAGTTQALTARVTTDLNEDYVKLKLFRNGKPLAHYKSRDYNASDAAAFVAEVEDEYVLHSGIALDSDDDNLIIGEETAQLVTTLNKTDGNTEDVTSAVATTYSSANTNLATVSSTGLVTPVVTGLTYATQTLTSDATAPANNATVTVAGQTYTFKTTLTASTTANEVLIGVSAATALDNLKSAINGTSGGGTTYGSLTTANAYVNATTNTDTTQVVESKESGTAGNALTVSETSSHLAWGAATLTGATTDRVDITATYTSPTSVVYTNKVTIRPVDARSIDATIADDTLTNGQTSQITVTAQLSDGTSSNKAGDSSYSSSATGVATVSAGGLVTGVNAQTAASGTLTSDATNVTDGDTVVIGNKTYRFKDTMAAINDVQIGSDAAGSLDNLKAAINLTGTSGVEWFAGTTIHSQVTATTNTDTTQLVVAKVKGTGANAYATTETSSHLSWGDTTLKNGAAGTATITVDYGNEEDTVVVTVDN